MKNSLEQLKVDNSYVLDLAETPERRENFEKVFEEQNLEVIRVEGFNKDQIEIVGEMLPPYEAQNHGVIKMIDLAFENGDEVVAFIESDIAFKDDASEVLAASVEKTTERRYLVDDETKPIYRFNELTGLPTEERIGWEKKEEIEMIAHLPANCDALSLGCWCSWWPPTHIMGRIWKLRHANNGVFWIFKKRFLVALRAELVKMELPYDECISKVFSDFDNYYACAIMGEGIAYQDPQFKSTSLKKAVDNSRTD
jgi:hypothetical protein